MSSPSLASHAKRYSPASPVLSCPAHLHRVIVYLRSRLLSCLPREMQSPLIIPVFPPSMQSKSSQPPPALIASSRSKTLSLNLNKKIVLPGHISSPSPAQCAVTPSVRNPAASHTPSIIPATNAAQFN